MSVCVCARTFLTSTISVQPWQMTCCLRGSMTETWTRALGFLSRPEATRLLQAGREGKKVRKDGETEKGSGEKVTEDNSDVGVFFLGFFCFCFLITVTHRRGFQLQHSMCKKNQHVFTSNSNHEAEAT